MYRSLFRLFIPCIFGLELQKEIYIERAREEVEEKQTDRVRRRETDRQREGGRENEKLKENGR